jgi:putative addiction module killer protein
MAGVQRTEVFTAWFDGLRDRRARDRILARIDRLSLGNSGDVKPVGEGVSEMRIGYGPGYRLYFIEDDKTAVLLLCGGTKRTQARDIKRAIEMAREARKTWRSRSRGGTPPTT